MALQCTQIPIAASIRFDNALVAPYRKSVSAKVGLQNSNITLQARFLRHCKRDITKQLRQGSTRTVCVQARGPKPTWIEMTPITGEAHFDEILASENPVIIDWMAAWCRKCIYLKPKLEKLAAEYHPDIKFYFVDVNTVPSSLVSRAEVTKMPTIQVNIINRRQPHFHGKIRGHRQLWKNKEKKGELIAGDQGWLVMEKIREMLSDLKK